MLLAPEATLGNGRYRLRSRRGVGGMATVWHGFDERLERPVAVKVLADTLAIERDFALRFEREARIAARLSHPGLVLLYDYGVERGRPFLVSEWVEGPDLHELWREGDRVDAEKLAVTLLGVLQYIHDEGVVHRDVKPSNVLVDDDGRFRLTDFGIAQPEDATRLTQTGMVMGTAPFVAPEVLAGEPSTPRSDLYSAGRLLMDGTADRLTPRLKELAERLSSDDPELRPASARAALESLRLDSADDTPRRPQPDGDFAHQPPPRATIEMPQATPEPTPPRRSLVWIAAGLAGLALAAFVIIAVGDGGDGPRQASVQSEAAQNDGNDGNGGLSSAADGEAAAEPAQEPAAPAPAEANSAYRIPEPGPNPKPEKGAALNQQGFDLINAGDPESAVKVLEKALRDLPPGTEDLNYAYALFNLGQALRLSGRPQDAIPVLEARLGIPNQTETVEQELALAREAAG